MKVGMAFALLLVFPGCGPASSLGGGRGGTSGRAGPAGGGRMGGVAATDASESGDVAAEASGDRGNVDPLCLTNPTFDQSCASDGDCVVAVRNGCVYVLVGLRATELDRFQTYQQRCNPSPPHSVSSCDFPPVPARTDDGSSLASGTAAVTCRAGTCTTYSSLCGRVCDPGTSCFACATVQGTMYAACSARCGSSSDCLDQAAPSCQTTWAGNESLQFCAPQAVACKLCDTCSPPADAGAAPDGPGDGPMAD